MSLAYPLFVFLVLLLFLPRFLLLVNPTLVFQKYFPRKSFKNCTKKFPKKIFQENPFWKTCSWGWDSRKKAQKLITYQLTLYKHFFCQKHNIDPKNVETHFALLKRTAKKDRVEIFRVTSGPKKTENALKLLYQAIYNISKRFYIKNRLACEKPYRCKLYKTEHCR